MFDWVMAGLFIVSVVGAVLALIATIFIMLIGWWNWIGSEFAKLF
jgi:hypothetical protein